MTPFVFNENWPRWITASLRMNFKGIIEPTYQLFIEGSGYKDETAKARCEFRVDGPHSHQLTSNEWYLEIVVNVLALASLDVPDKDLIFRICGKVATAFKQTIPIYRYGTDIAVDDLDQNNPTIYGCLILKQDAQHPIAINHFGQINPSVRLTQSSIEGNYKVRFTQRGG
jgi:hypothetical protein